MSAIKKRERMLRSIYFLLALYLLAGSELDAQDYGSRLGNVKRGGKVSWEPTGPGVLFDALDPAVRKWYVPQELYNEFNWRQWEYSNYARDNYQRYVSTALEGNYIYDVYGNLLTRGWLVFDWRQQNPQPFGSLLTKDGRFGGWFSNLLIASDHKGQFHYAITVGNEIRTTLTPMTFSKPRFDGIQWDFQSDKYAATMLLSRISNTSGSETSNNTSMLGGRVEMQVGDFVKVGGTFVNAHHAQTQTEVFNGNILKGNLTGEQNVAQVTLIEVRIKDDSPEDGETGGALFAHDIVIWDLNGKQTRGSEIGFRPLIEGGFQRRGFLSADGSETISLRYDFQDRSYTGPDPGEIKRVQIELVLANDYLVEMASDRQNNFQGNVVFLPVAKAPGNVKDSSNQRVLAIDYGLPTANQITGFTLELTDLEGLDAYFEVNVNSQYKQYPNPALQKNYAGSTEASAWMLNVSKQTYPYFAFLEAFRTGPNYQTGLHVVDQNGIVDYGSEFRYFEFVDDNDDQDRFPDWQRSGFTSGDVEVFPGWDENNDFISDFNQNDSPASPNRIPDYDEPFLRFHTDRPEYLYGIDMNHNGTIDRFENDEEADLPYLRDRRGYNIYGGVYLLPDVRLTLGRQRMREISGAGRSKSDYAILTADHRFNWLRLRLFQDLRQVKDDIADDLLQWVQLPNSRGELIPQRDALPAQNTIINTSWLGVDLTHRTGLKLKNILKWKWHHQRDRKVALGIRDQRHNGSFLGLINKAEYRIHLGKVSLIPAWKSEFRRESPVDSRIPRRLELSEIFLLMSRVPVFLSSYIEGGLEHHRFSQLRDPTPPGGEDSFRETTIVTQLTNISDYQGYRLTTVIGFDMTRRHFEVEGTRTRTRGFLTVYAGVER
jgi:hypothetical protein